MPSTEYPLMKEPKYIVWNYFDNMSTDGNTYSTLGQAIEAAKQWLLRYKEQGYYACAQRDIVNIYGVAEGSRMNAHVPLRFLQACIVDAEDAEQFNDIQDIAMASLVDVSFVMNPIHQDVVMGERIKVELGDMLEENWMICDLVETWNKHRERHYED